MSRTTTSQDAKARAQEKLRTPLAWAKRYLKDPSNPKKAWRPMWMQESLLGDHGHRLNTVRAQRGEGKTQGVIAILLHYAFTNANKDILVIGPSMLVVQRVFESIWKQLRANPDLEASVAESRKTPSEIKLTNGTMFRGLSTNVASKKHGQNIRGEHPDVIYVDEADYLYDEDYKAFAPLFDISRPGARPPLVYMTTTPTGRRSKFYYLCESKGAGEVGERWHDWWFAARHVEGVTFKGEYSVDDRGFPVPDENADVFVTAVNPHWTRAQDNYQRNENGEQGWYHEQIAWWGDSTYSVFPRELVENAMNMAKKQRLAYHVESSVPHGLYVVGVDVDKSQATPVITVVEYVPNQDSPDGSGGTFVVRFREEVARPANGRVIIAAKQRIIQINGAFVPRSIEIDKGYGDPMVEELQEIGLRHAHGRWFKENVYVINPVTYERSGQPLKHVMIAMAKRAFENNRVLIPPVSLKSYQETSSGEIRAVNDPEWDDELIKQLINYQVTGVTSTGIPQYTAINEHAVDSFLLALYGAIELFDKPFALEFSSAVETITAAERTGPFRVAAMTVGGPQVVDKDLRIHAVRTTIAAATAKARRKSATSPQRAMSGFSRRTF